MQGVATRDGFSNLYYSVPSIGGRYSALSNFGMAPTAAMGVDVQRFLETADAMARECSATSTVENNPGVILGGFRSPLSAFHRLGL